MSPLERMRNRQQAALALLGVAPPRTRPFLTGAVLMGALMLDDAEAAAARTASAEGRAFAADQAAQQAPTPEAGAAGPEGSGCSGTGQSQPAEPPPAGAQRVEAPPAKEPPPPPAAEPAQADAPAASEDPTPPPAAKTKPVKWTPERKQAIRTWFPQRDDVRMAAAVNALPGEAATIEQCLAHADYMGLKRPRFALPPAPPARAPTPQPAGNNGKVHRATLPRRTRTRPMPWSC
ncbi:hypothetical protein HB662_01395 [Roseomonas frigidaquae]|uniref:Uncharacterized protein n=1 Tax=Falsiroseomonas frigidaquae TaxID=487318 RepID=A0ABX1EVX7_9PROT|nr:hypothetical protein [Falsiroseomonas frigidaquae]NKE43414.1 hypothetical protein [Falsiroseomonas frigidaquae]